jgi:glycosyltransferase involved in cell wall biosynthesis
LTDAHAVIHLTPEQCRFRTPLDDTTSDDGARCGMVGRLIGVRDPRVDAVTYDACQACCRSLGPPDSVNPVVASLVYRMAGEIERSGGVPGCDAHQARLVRARVANHLSFISARLPDRCFPPADLPSGARETSSPGGASRPGVLRWQVGLLTAPRGNPVIQQTLVSLQAAGFSQVDIFAEPGSWLPPAAGRQRTLIHQHRLGNLTNFYNTLAALYERAPDADAFAVFQDDVRVAHGAKEWCEREFWPLGAGLVSLFTARPHARPQAGWCLLSPGFYRVCGAQALVFRRDVLRRFLADPLVIKSLQIHHEGDDAVLASWAARHHEPIAYHTPSLVQHMGHVSSIYVVTGTDPRNFADAVDSVEQLPAWRPPPRRPGKIGLVGWHTATGLGYQNYDLAKHLNVDRWLVPSHPELPPLPRPELPCRTDYLASDGNAHSLRRWLKGLDWLLFAETPCCPQIVHAAREIDVNVACIPNWEFLHPEFDWLARVDLMICPTRHTYRHVCDWKQRYGFGWEVLFAACPIDGEAFPFRQRTRCDRFVFINGWGGGRPRRLDGSRVSYHRKGAELIVEAAKMAPQLSFVVYSQTQLDGLPRGVELRAPPVDNHRLYDDGDVCVQPSHYEGIGLQLLECQAAGMPLITTDAPPMNEHQPLDVVAARDWEIVQLFSDQPIASQVMSAEDLVEVLRRWHGADISEASLRAREFMEREHSFPAFRKVIEAKLVAYPRI